MTPTRASQCPYHCPDGNPCVLDAEVPHTLHICHKSACACHSAQRYQPDAIVETTSKLTQTHRRDLARARTR